MSEKGAEYFDEREKHRLSVTLTHLAGLLNVEADASSRQQSTHIDWQVNVKLIRQAWSLLHTKPAVDLFASAANCQIKRFYSYHHDHRSLGTDCLQHPWGKLGTLYAYPPPILIGKTLQKARHERCDRLILVAPLWMAQAWWPTLLAMLLQPPVILPNVPWLATDQMGRETWPTKWPLLVCDLSGELHWARASRKQYWKSAGGITKTDIHYCMTALLRSSGCGGSAPTAALNSVLGIFNQA
jgi:hypothetical protein